MKMKPGDSVLQQQRLRRGVIVAAVLIIATWSGAEALGQVAAGTESGELNPWTMGMGLLGGLALFLFG